MSNQNYRLYTFVAGLYLSELQKGLQTAHVVGDLSQEYSEAETPEGAAFATWADEDKTIVICTAGNHRGVEQAYMALDMFKELNLPHTIFYEDEDSMNGMATAAGIIVPQKYWDVKMATDPVRNVWVYTSPDGSEQVEYEYGTNEHGLITTLKSFRLA